jgi:hypothetical protein
MGVLVQNTLYYYTQYENTLHIDIQHKEITCETQKKWKQMQHVLFNVMLYFIMLCRYAECCYTECRGVQTLWDVHKTS